VERRFLTSIADNWRRIPLIKSSKRCVFYIFSTREIQIERRHAKTRVK